MIKLIATDMDGTLLNSHKKLPMDFIPWVLNHPEMLVVIASGRQYFTLYDEFGQAADRIIYLAENGGLVFEHGQTLYQNTMDKEDVLRILTLVDSLPGLTPILCGVQSAYMRRCLPFVESQGHMYYHRLAFRENLASCVEEDETVKVAVYVENDCAAEAVSAFAQISEHLKAVVSGTDWIDIGNRSVNKGTALREIQRLHGISPGECMGFGDYMNDYEMLEACGASYAMANACEEIKALAKYHTLSNDEDGVMKVLRTVGI